MRPLTIKTNTDPAGFPWIYGRSRDNTGLNDGTPSNENTWGDSVQFFERMMFRSGLTPNNLEDNGTNGWQLHQALQQTIMAYKAVYIYNGNTTLTDDNFGSFNCFVNNFSPPPTTFTLPAAVIANVTKKMMIMNFAATTLTVAIPGSDTILPTTPIILNQYDSVQLATIGLGFWVVVSIYRYKPVAAITLSPSNYTTSGASNETITGASFTTDATVAKSYRITFSGSCQWSTTNSASDGANIDIKNITTNASLSLVATQQLANSTGGGATMVVPFCLSVVVNDVPPSTVIGGTVSRVASFNPTLTGMKVLIEELR